MLSTEFTFYLKDIELFYLGCFSSNNYPKKMKKYNFFIVNKDASFEKGSHWMCVYKGEKEIEFFDSCGGNEEFVKSFLKFSKTMVCVFNETPLQPSTSNSCGEFCIYFAHKRLLNKDQSFGNVLNRSFTLNKEKNNEKVVKFCQNLLKN